MVPAPRHHLLPCVLAGFLALFLPPLLQPTSAEEASGALTVSGGGSVVTDGLDLVDQDGVSLSQAAATVAMGSVSAGATGSVTVFTNTRRLQISIGYESGAAKTVTMQVQFGALCTGCTSNNEWRSTTTPVLSMAAGGTSATGRSTGSGSSSANASNFADRHNTDLCAGHTAGAGNTVLGSAMTIHNTAAGSNGCITHLLGGVVLKHFVPSNQPNDAYETKLLFTLS